MVHQVVAIHGGDTFATYEDYLAFLRAFKVDADYLRKKRWRETLGEALGPTFEVLAPRMPNNLNARFAEWKIWFEKIIPHLSEEVTLVGHSLGGLFLAKYLAENAFPKKIVATFLVAAVYDDASDTGSLADFTIPASLEWLAKQGGQIFLYHSQDDPLVPWSDFEKYRAALPQATARTFSDRQHFSQAQLPELVADIRSLYPA